MTRIDSPSMESRFKGRNNGGRKLERRLEKVCSNINLISVMSLTLIRNSLGPDILDT